MVKQIILPLLILLSSCGVSIKSMVDHSSINQPFERPLIIILFEKKSTKNFSYKIKEKLKIEFDKKNIEAEFLLVESKNEELALNQNDVVNTMINKAIKTHQRDIVLIFRPTHLSYYNGKIGSITYEFTGIDATTQKEVWKAKFDSKSLFGPPFYPEKSSQIILEKLRIDNIL